MTARTTGRNAARGLALWAGVTCVVTAAPAAEMPTRKAGLWEMKVGAGPQMPAMVMQQCTDEKTDKQLQGAFSPADKGACSKNDVKVTATGFVSDSVCTFGGMTATSHSEVTGDFNSAFTVKATSQTTGIPQTGAGDTPTVIEARWLGPCKADQKPGDIVMPGGMTMNVNDLAKMQGQGSAGQAGTRGGARRP